MEKFCMNSYCMIARALLKSDFSFAGLLFCFGCKDELSRMNPRITLCHEQ